MPPVFCRHQWVLQKIFLQKDEQNMPNCLPCRKGHCSNYMETQPKASPDDLQPMPSDTNSVSGQEESHNGENTSETSMTNTVTQLLAEEPSLRSSPSLENIPPALSQSAPSLENDFSSRNDSAIPEYIPASATNFRWGSMEGDTFCTCIDR